MEHCSPVIITFTLKISPESTTEARILGSSTLVPEFIEMGTNMATGSSPSEVRYSSRISELSGEPPTALLRDQFFM